jgi:hypothetical protein
VKGQAWGTRNRAVFGGFDGPFALVRAVGSVDRVVGIVCSPPAERSGERRLKLLVSQRLDRVDAGAVLGGVEPGHDTDNDSHGNDDADPTQPGTSVGARAER